MLSVRHIGLFGLLFGIYAGLSLAVPPLDDELYYWCWSKDWQWSYYDHPPVTALSIRLTATLFGDTLWAIRLPACAAMALVGTLISFWTQNRAVTLALLCTPMMSFGAVLMTPDSPFLACWAGYISWMMWVHQRLQKGPVPALGWLLGGLILGLGILSKYSMGLAVPAGLFSLLLAKPVEQSRWWLGYMGHGMMAAVVSLPILIFNLEQDFAPLKYQWLHAMAADQQNHPKFWEFLGIQAVLVGTLPLVLLPWVLWRWRRIVQTAKLRVAACFYVLPFVFLLYKASQKHMEGNWALMCYLSFWPLLAEWVRQRPWQSWTWPTIRWAFVIPWMVVGITAIHLLTPLPIIPVKPDRLTRQKARSELASSVVHWLESQPEPLVLYTPTYQWVSLLRFTGWQPTWQIEDLSRESHFTRHPDRPAHFPKRFWYFSEFPLEDHYVPEHDPPRVVASFSLQFRGEVYDIYHIWEFQQSSTSPSGGDVDVAEGLDPNSPHHLRRH